MATRRRDTDRVKRLTDPRAIRALAHEARQSLLAMLGRGRVVTATEVSGELGISPSAASYHLRQLAKYGLAEPAAEGSADGRERRWQGTFDSLVMAPEGGGVDRDSAAAHLEIFQAALRQSVLNALALPDPPDDDPVPDDGVGVTVGRAGMRLTPDRVNELADRFRDLIAEFDRADELAAATIPIDIYFLMAPQGQRWSAEGSPST